MQTIEAIKHLKEKMGVGKNKISLTDYDRACLNRIIEHFNESSKQVGRSQVLFKKLFINDFLRSAVFYNHGTRAALQSMEDLLRVPLSHYYEVFADESKFKAYKYHLKKLEYVEPQDLSTDPIERELQKEKNKDILERNYEDLKDTLLNGTTPEKAKNFMEKHLYELILKYRDYE